MGHFFLLLAIVSCTERLSYAFPLAPESQFVHLCLILYLLYVFQNIKKDIKKFQRMFEIKDRMSQSRASKVILIAVSSLAVDAKSQYTLYSQCY